jgi:hypothetical protein
MCEIDRPNTITPWGLLESLRIHKEGRNRRQNIGHVVSCLQKQRFTNMSKTIIAPGHLLVGRLVFIAALCSVRYFLPAHNIYYYYSLPMAKCAMSRTRTYDVRQSQNLATNFADVLYDTHKASIGDGW